MIKKLNFLFVTIFGLGKISKIPGSLASLLTVILLFSLIHGLKISADKILIILALFSIGSYIKDNEDKDPKEIVIDELIGQSIPICLYEIAHNNPKEINEILTFYFIMFILFRIFDITKPYPVSYYDKNFKNSFGVIMDDVCAGLYVVAIFVFYMIITT